MWATITKYYWGYEILPIKEGGEAMAFDKKTSMYPNSGKSGSPEELEAYGVWVKSEPQDLASGFADVSDFPGASDFSSSSDFSTSDFSSSSDFLDASDFTGVSGFDDASFADAAGFNSASGFNSMFDDIGLSDDDLSTGESQDFGLGEFSFDNFDDGSLGQEPSEYERFNDPFNNDQFTNDLSGGVSERDAQEEMSTHLLMKIADELTSIKDELTTLKKEFKGSRADSSASVSVSLNETEKPQGGFFSEEGDDRLALTGDEMENILNSADLTSDENPFDPLREEDEAALKRLSEQNDAAAQDEVEIDFDNLGVFLDDNKTGDESVDDELGTSGALGIGNSMDDFPSLDDVDELENLRLEDVDSLTDDDPFSLPNDGLDSLSLNENSMDLNLEESDLGSLNFNDMALEDAQSTDELTRLEDTASFDAALSLDDTLSLEEMSSLNDMLSLEPSQDAESENDGIVFPTEEEALTESAPELAASDPDLDDISLDLDDFKMSADEEARGSASDDDSLARVIPEAFETESGDDTSIPLDDDLEGFADEDLSLDDLELEKEDSLAAKAEKVSDKDGFSSEMRNEVRKVLAYMDHLLESLPEEKIEEFAKSEHFDTYKKLFKELGLV
jgi:hypothetical protein